MLNFGSSERGLPSRYRPILDGEPRCFGGSSKVPPEADQVQWRILQPRVRGLGFLCIAVGVLGALAAYLYSEYAPGVLADYIPAAFTSVWIIFVYTLAIPYIAAGVGLIQLRPWARQISMVVLTCGVVSIPLGTALGIYGISLLMSDEADEVFSPRFNRS